MKLDPGFRREFSYPGNQSLKVWGCIAGGVVLLLVAVAGFFLTLRTRGNTVQLTLTTTLPVLFAVGLFGTAYALSRAPRAVVLSSAGVTIVSPGATREHAWDEVAWSDVDTSGIGNHKRLNLYGRDGRALVRIPQGIHGFDDLVALFKAHHEQSPSADATTVQWKHARKRGIQLTIGGVLACLLGIANAYVAYEEHASAKLLESRGAPGTAQVVRKFTAPDGVTRRIEFKVIDPSGASDVHNVELEPAYWTLLPENAELPVTTVPGRPDVARLSFGEVTSDKTSPALMGAVSALVIVIGLLVLAAAVMSFRGVDVNYDSSTGFQIRRIGKPRPART
jgi:hypothetical protein